MTFGTLKLLFAITTATAPIMAEARPVQTEFISVTYRCERDVELPVVFVNDAQGRGYAIALIEGKLRTLSQAISASGARYRGEADIAYELWNKGDTAMISYGAEDDSEIIYKDCTEISEDEAS